MNTKIFGGKPRVLIFLNRLVIGGQAADTFSLAWHLRSDFQILVLVGEKEKDEIEPKFLFEKYPGVALKKNKYLRRSINPFIDLLAFFHVLVTIIRYKPHIVHTHGSKPGFAGRLSAWICGVPVIIHTFHGHIFHSYFSTPISHLLASVERAVAKLTDCAVALSESQKTELVNEYKILPSSKVIVISLGFSFDDNKDYSAFRQNFRQKYNLNDEDVAVGIVGRIVPVKNHSFFVKVIDGALRSNVSKSPAFFIIGDGELRVQIEQELNERNIRFDKRAITAETRVVLTSWLSNIEEVMSGLDIVVLTSLNEGTPLSIIEGQFFEKPVVATNTGGVKDSMKDGITGFLVENNDMTAFCEKLLLLVTDKKLRNTMGREGKKFVTEKFSKQKEVAAIKELYLSLLTRKGHLTS